MYFQVAINPLDYFLNAKPYVHNNPPRPRSRSPSPSGRTSPYKRRGSLSPARRSPGRRSLSPENRDRGRSTSAERSYDGRRRSNSVDRSRSPGRNRDTRRFGRRSRSPPRRRSRLVQCA